MRIIDTGQNVFNPLQAGLVCGNTELTESGQRNQVFLRTVQMQLPLVYRYSSSGRIVVGELYPEAIFRQ